MAIPASVRNLTLAVGCLGLLAGCAGTDPNARPSADPMARPEVTRSLFEAAAAAEAQNDFASASGYYRNIVTHDPNNVRALVGLMQSLRTMGVVDEAREVADKAVASRPNDPAIIAEAGKVRLAAGQLQEAVVLLQRVAALEPQDWKSRSALGVAYDRLGNSKRAEESYQDALKISPDNVSVLNNLALSRAMANDLGGARELLQRAVAIAGSDIRVRQNLALIYALSGDMAQAEALTLRDLPPDQARETLAYYRDLAGRAQTRPADVLPTQQP
jgi:Flp pilus assembly protein TadD